MDAINLSTTPNFKNTYICSNHFDVKSYYDWDEFRRRKRLRPDAVPKNINSKISYFSTENVTPNQVTESVLGSSINTPENNILKEKNLEQNKNCDKETDCEIGGEKIPVNSLDTGSLNEEDCSSEPNNSRISNDSSSTKRLIIIF